MNILVVSSYLPYPLYSGGNIRLYNLLKKLRGNHKITLVCEIRDWQTQNDIKEIKKICDDVFVIPRKKQWSIFTILQTGFSKNPFLIAGHRSAMMKDIVRKLLRKNKYDLIHAETFYILQNIPKANIPTVIAEHNIEYDVYKRYAGKANIFLKPLLEVDVLKLKLIEQKAWEDSGAIIVVSENDKKIIEKINENVFVVPNGVDLEKFRFDKKNALDKKEITILFIGDFKWLQNRDTLGLILKIWPKINSEFKIQNPELKLKLWVVGKNIPGNLKEGRIEGVKFDENAPDETPEIFRRSDILLAPIYVGGGTSYKILEAMASGVPVVTTRLGIDGLGASDGKHALVVETEEEIKEKVLDILSDNNLYIKIAENARKLIEEKYDWEKIAESLERIYKKII